MNLRLSLLASQRVLKGLPFIGAQDQLSYRDIPAAGAILRAQTAEGDFLAHVVSDGPGRPVCFRVLSRERRPDFTPQWWAGQVEQALGKRRAKSAQLGQGPQRLVQAEADGLPGLTVDLWAPGFATLTLVSPGLLPVLEFIEEALVQQAKLTALWRKTPLEGVMTLSPWHRSPLLPRSTATVTVAEGPARFAVNMEAGETGLPAMDRRHWRAQVQSLAAARPGTTVLCLGECEGERAAALAAGANPAVDNVPGDSLKALQALATKGKTYGLVLGVMPAQGKFSWGKFIFAKQGGPWGEALAAVTAPGGALLWASVPQEDAPFPGLDMATAGLAWSPVAPPPDLPPLGPGLAGTPPAWTASRAQA
jgi:hypothetical protein